MKFKIVPMTDEQAGELASWKYEGIYAFYDLDTIPEDVAELMDPLKREGKMFAALDDSGEMVGFFDYTLHDGTVVIGLGLRPDLTGNGLGESFVRAGLQFSRETHSPSTFQLTVWAVNQRAIRIYERVGFKPVREFEHTVNGKGFPFVEMNRPAVLNE